MELKNIYPYPSIIHPQVEKIEINSQQWAISHGLAKAEYLNVIKVGHLLGRALPNAKVELVTICCQLAICIYIIDDYCEKNGVKTVKQIISVFTNILEDQTINNDNNELSSIILPFQNIWLDLKKSSPLSWQQHFKKNMHDYLHALLWEAKNREANNVPNIDEYIKMRNHSAGVYWTLNLMEFSDEYFLPDSIRNNVMIKEIEHTASQIMYSINDFFSAERELQLQDFHNLVIVYNKHENITVKEAMYKVLDFHNEQLKKFIEYENAYLHFEKEDAIMVKKYITAISKLIRGHLDWSIIDIPRYKKYNILLEEF
ncbi:terpene synthase family protein [Chryseobacterium polytrichastri]|nr:hypothetical protein [Chryseobacterium polytrichastri]